MKLIQLEQFLQHEGIIEHEERPPSNSSSACESSSDSSSVPASSFNQGNIFTIPPTIPECDDC